MAAPLRLPVFRGIILERSLVRLLFRFRCQGCHLDGTSRHGGDDRGELMPQLVAKMFTTPIAAIATSATMMMYSVNPCPLRLESLRPVLCILIFLLRFLICGREGARGVPACSGERVGVIRRKSGRMVDGTWRWEAERIRKKPENQTDGSKIELIPVFGCRTFSVSRTRWIWRFRVPARPVSCSLSAGTARPGFCSFPIVPIA